MKRPYKKIISVLLTTTMLNLCWLTSYGWAEMVRTQETPPQITREMLIDVLHRKDVQKQFEQYGISKVEAVARINSLTDEEISALVKEMDDLRAGGQAEAAIAEGTVYGALIVVVLAMLAVMVVIIFLGTLFKGIKGILSDGDGGNAHYETDQTTCPSQCGSKFSECMKTWGLTNKSPSVCKEEEQMCLQACSDPEAKLEEKETLEEVEEAIDSGAEEEPCDPGWESCT